jgi:hypothetical protein
MDSDSLTHDLAMLENELASEEGRIKEIDQTLAELAARKRVIESRVAELRFRMIFLRNAQPKREAPDSYYTWASTAGIDQLRAWWAGLASARADCLSASCTEILVALQTHDIVVANKRTSALNKVLVDEEIKGGRVALYQIPCEKGYTAYYYRTTH